MGRHSSWAGLTLPCLQSTQPWLSNHIFSNTFPFSTGLPLPSSPSALESQSGLVLTFYKDSVIAGPHHSLWRSRKKTSLKPQDKALPSVVFCFHLALPLPPLFHYPLFHASSSETCTIVCMLWLQSTSLSLMDTNLPTHLTAEKFSYYFQATKYSAHFLDPLFSWANTGGNSSTESLVLFVLTLVSRYIGFQFHHQKKN